MAIVSAATEEQLNKEIKAKLAGKKVLFGTNSILQELREGTAGKLQTIVLAHNCPAKAAEDITYYARLAGIPVVTSGLSNEDLGIFCKKNFFIAALGLSA